MSAILSFNAGSSSLKFAVHDANSLQETARGEVTGLRSKPVLSARAVGQVPTQHPLPEGTSALAALNEVLAWISANRADAEFVAIGNRVVHGGERFVDPIVLDDAIVAELEQLDPLAPLHQPINLAIARALRQRFPEALSVACFDTAFHAQWPDCVKRLALPRRWRELGVRRYGFHGLSFEYLAQRVHVLAPRARRVVLMHLGSGASACAVLDGHSIDSTMGFSVLDGLPMATRSGAIDSGVIFHLCRRHAMSLEAVEAMLYHDSGLLGVSGITGDMRALLGSPAAEAREAIDLFVHRCVASVGALTATLGGLDALVFSGGVGAHAPQIRAAICAKLSYFGLRIANLPNAAGRERIAGKSSRVRVFALSTDEESVIARHCQNLLPPRMRVKSATQ